jgi:hypothetical protein
VESGEVVEIIMMTGKIIVIDVIAVVAGKQMTVNRVSVVASEPLAIYIYIYIDFDPRCSEQSGSKSIQLMLLATADVLNKLNQYFVMRHFSSRCFGSFLCCNCSTFRHTF